MKIQSGYPAASVSLWGFLGFLAVCFVLPPSYGQEKTLPPPSVLVGEAVVRRNEVNKKYVGYVEAIQTVAVQPRVSGNIMEMHFKEGGNVKKDQLLFAIEDTQYKAKVQNVEAMIAQIDSRIEYARLSHERYQKLVKSSSVAQDTVDSSKSTLTALDAEKKAAEAELAMAKDNLAYTRISSPIDGRVGRVTYSVGNYITPQSPSLLTITNLDELYVRFSLSERDLLSLFGTPEGIKKQGVVSLMLANGTPYELTGKVVMTDNQVQSSTGTQNVWALFKNPEKVLVPGGVVTVVLSKKDVDEFPAVNVSAVQHSQNKSFVYVLNDKNEVEKREVLLGNMIDNQQLFREGIKSGDRVIVDGMHKIQPGMTVVPVQMKE